MAIEHLLKETLTEVGKIKIGGLGEERASKGGGTYRMPEKYDHFILTTMMRDKDERLVADAALMDSLKPHADPRDGKLRRLPVVFMSNDLSEILTARYVAYAGKRVAAKSDGLTVTEYQDKPGGAWLPLPAERAHTPELVERWNMKLATVLNVMIQSPASRWGGVYRFRTTSRISADQLYGSLKWVQKLTGGILRGVPFWMVLRPMQVAPDGKPTTIYVVHCEVMGEDVKAIREAAMEQMKYELANVREVRAIERQYLQLLAHEYEPDADDLAELHPETGELITAGGEVIEPKTVPPPPPATATDWSRPESFGDNKKAFAKLVSRKGQNWAQVMTWLNLKFRTGYTRDAKWEGVPEEHRREAARQLLEMKDAEVKP